MSLNVANSIADAWFRLGFRSQADMEAAGAWVTPAELYQFADDAIKGLARASAVFLTYDESTPVIPATAQYPLPARSVFTEGAWLIYASPAGIQLLRLTGATQLFAIDSRWPGTTGIPTRISLDAGDINTATLYPVPAAAATLAMIIEVYPPDVTSTAPVLPITGILQDAVTYAMLAGALSKESDYAKLEVAKHCRERMALYAAIVRRLWGTA